MPQLRIATFNLENFDELAPGRRPSLAERVALMRPQIVRLRPDVICLQEVNGQERPGSPRQLLALAELLAGTVLEGAALASTTLADGQVMDERNLVVVSRLPVKSSRQLKNELVAEPLYRRLTAVPPDAAPVAVGVERPVLHVELDLGAGRVLHLVNVHLKSKLPTAVPGQTLDAFTWRAADAWAEGVFLSSMKRMSQAVEVRRLVDEILTDDPDARIVVAGDFNASSEELPVLTICGNVEDTGNTDLSTRVLVPVESTIPEPARHSLFHHGRGEMIDHMLVTRNLLAAYRGSEIHNELLHDESAGFATDQKFPESDHAPLVAQFELD